MTDGEKVKAVVDRKPEQAVMTSIVDWAVATRALVIALILVVLIAGIIAFIKIPKEAEPDIPIPMLIGAGDLSGHQPGGQRAAARQAA